MTDSQPHLKPTSRQLRYLKDLAIRTGGSFAYPQTVAEASAEIDRLKQRKPTSRAERRGETRELRREMAERRGDASSVRLDELGGWGAGATWAKRA